jgi:hypothetical protein
MSETLGLSMPSCALEAAQNKSGIGVEIQGHHTFSLNEENQYLCGAFGVKALEASSKNSGKM